MTCAMYWVRSSTVLLVDRYRAISLAIPWDYSCGRIAVLGSVGIVRPLESSCGYSACERPLAPR